MKTKLIIAMAVLGAAVMASTPASAQTAPEVFDKCANNLNGAASALYARSCANTTVNASQSAASGGIGNGFNAQSNFAQGNGSFATSSSDNGWTNRSASAAGNSSISTSSSLTDGKLHAFGTSGSDGQGFSIARMSDIVTFNNVSGDVVTLGIGYSFDGQYIGAGGSNFDYASIFLHLGSPTRDINFAASGQQVGGYGQTLAWGDGFFDQQWLNAGTPSDFTFTRFGMPGSGPFGGSVSTTIAIPTGISQLGFAFTLDIGCRVANSICDFGNTSTFKFDALPSGLSYTSDSGVLFSALDQGAVPEPATWALMISGFGLAGSSMRRRRSTTAMA